MKNKDNGVKYIFTRGLTLTFTGFIFNMMALPVLSIPSPFWSVLISIAIMLLFYYVVFVFGRMSGEHCFKAYKRNLLRIKQGESISKSQKLLEYHWSKGFLFSAIYYIWQIILLVIALIIKNKALNLIISYYNLAFANILNTTEIIQKMGDTSSYNALFFIVIIIVPLIFEAGFVLSGEKLKKQHQEIKMEIRMFNS